MLVNRSAPTATVVPVLIYDDVAKALEWLCAAFEFVERLRAAGPDGDITHAQLDIAEGAIIVGKQGGPFTAQTSVVNQYVHITVENVDSHSEHAKHVGAEIVEPPSNMPWGERQYTARDHAGHWWAFSQHIADMAPEEWGAISASGR